MVEEDQKEYKNPFIQSRTKRVNMLKQYIKDKPEMTIEQLIATFSLDTGTSPKRVREYVQMLLDSKQASVQQKGIQEFLRLEKA
jgi:hypothetical protein